MGKGKIMLLLIIAISISYGISVERILCEHPVNPRGVPGARDLDKIKKEKRGSGIT